MTLLNTRFSKAIASFDGDEQLFAELAQPVAEHYRLYADQIRLLLDDKNEKGLQKVAHKLKATWALYTTDNTDLPERLEAAIKSGQSEMVLTLAESLTKSLYTVSRDLANWVEWFSQNGKDK